MQFPEKNYHPNSENVSNAALTHCIIHENSKIGGQGCDFAICEFHLYLSVTYSGKKFF
jgi:hypothetical protein